MVVTGREEVPVRDIFICDERQTFFRSEAVLVRNLRRYSMEDNVFPELGIEDAEGPSPSEISKEGIVDTRRRGNADFIEEIQVRTDSIIRLKKANSDARITLIAVFMVFVSLILLIVGGFVSYLVIRNDSILLIILDLIQTVVTVVVTTVVATLWERKSKEKR
jgi:hypothetical protein